MRRLLFLIGLYLLASNSFSFDGGTRYIKGIGCHTHDRICFVNVEGVATGPNSSCNSTSFRWSADTDPNHNEIFSLLTAAFMANKKVHFTLESSCFTLQPNFPTLAYITVLKE